MVDLFPRKIIYRGQARYAEAVGEHLNFHMLKAIQEFPNSISDCPQNSAAKVENDHGKSMTPHQVAKLLRELGLATKKSNGFTVVMPDRDTLLKACEEAGYEGDAAITALRSTVQNAPLRKESTCSHIEKESTCSPTDSGSTSTSSGEGGPLASNIDNPYVRAQPLTTEQHLALHEAHHPSVNESQASALPSTGRRISLKPSDQEPSQPARRSRKRRRARR